MAYTAPESGHLSPATAFLRQIAGAVHLAEQEREAAEHMVRRSFGVTVKSVDTEKRTVRVVASTTALDSYGEIVEQDWDLSRYENDPVVLYRHNQPVGFLGSLTAEETLPIGFATDVGVVDGALEATLNFVDEKATPLAEKVYQGFVQGSLHAVSVGFNPRDVREEKRDGQDVYVLSNNELYEISVVPMGANPEAVAKTAEHNRAQLRRMIQPVPSGPDSTQEPEMDQKQIAALQAEVETAKSEAVAAGEKLASETAGREAAEAKAADAETRLAALTVERDALLVRAEKAEDLSIKQEIEALVGKKITPAEREAMTTLRKEKPELFTQLMAARGELGLSTPLPADKDHANSVADNVALAAKLGDDLAAEANAAAAAAVDGK